MDWNKWHEGYDVEPSMQARLGLVREQVASALSSFPDGPIKVVSLCAGDGRDLIGALRNHPRREQVTAWLLDTHEPSLDRGQSEAEAAGLANQIHFVNADAALARNYLGLVPCDLILVSGVLGYLSHSDVARLIEILPSLGKPGTCVVWNRHLVMRDGAEQVPAIREHLRRTGFDEVCFTATAPDGFAVGRARFTGEARPFDPKAVFFEFQDPDRHKSGKESGFLGKLKRWISV